MNRGERLHERCGCAGAGGPFVLGGTSRSYERPRPFTVRRLHLDLTLEVKRRSVEGVATLDLERLGGASDELTLDAIGFELRAVELAIRARFRPVDFEYDGEKLVVSGLAGIERAKLRVSYRATPRRGLYFLEPDAKVKGRPRQVWSQCQDEDARHWFPCLDKPHVKMSTELRVTVPKGWIALSNGRCLSRPKRGAKGPAVFHYRLDEPHPSYLVSLVAGEFAEIEDRPARLAGGREVPVTYYVPRARRADVARSLGETPGMIERLSELLGVAYPYERYSQVVVSDFIFGGMENTTLTTLYEHALLDERAAIDVTSTDLVAHELAHQWFGDYVTCRDWSHAWLNEGFATFFEAIELEQRLGRDEYDLKIAADRDSYLAEARGRYTRPIVSRDYKEPIDLFDRHLYEKGGLVLHMLRRQLGDQLFFRGVRRYLERHARGIVETNDLMRALEEVSGESLERFFDEWVYRPGHPELKVTVSWDKGLLSVRIRQKQKGPDVATFSFSCEVDVAGDDGRIERHQKLVSDVSDVLLVHLAKRPKFVIFDPELRVAGSVELEVPADMLRKALSGAPSAYGRWSAAEALGKRDDAPTVRALAESLLNEREAWMVRAEAATALGKIKGDEALAALVRGCRSRHAKVRRAAAAALGAFPTPRAATLLAGLARSDRSYLVAAEAARSLGKTKAPAALKTLLALLDQRSWADTRRAGALDGLGRLGDERALGPIAERTRYGEPARGRRAAIHALAQVSDARGTRRKIEELLSDRELPVRLAAVDALASLADPGSRGALRQALEHESEGRVKRRLREALRETGDGGAADRKRLSDDLESVRGELAELKTRFAKLEAAKPRERSSRHPARAKRRAARPRAKLSRKR